MLARSLLCLRWYMGFKVKKEYPEVNRKKRRTSISPS
jgi:hypothetical protein